MSKKTLAFTLAEVLVAMSIIGVVAAMTIPTLHYTKTKSEYTAKLKNFYSRMENAVEDMQIDKGSFRDMKLPENTKASRWAWYMQNIDPYMGHQYLDETNATIYYKDGSSLALVWTGGCLDVDYDVNGKKSPNREGYDKQRFLYCFTDRNRKNYFGNKDIFFGTYGGSDNGIANLSTSGVSRQTLINACKANAPSCTKLLQNDNWEFKQDYPYKF